MQAAAPKVEHLYVHVPFCATKCRYCAFHSHPGGDAQMNTYVDALLREFESVALRLAPTTIFFGGGTPSILPVPLWKKILDAIAKHFPVPPVEWTIECNPATVDADKARLWRDAGVNRISIGVQSFDDSLLQRLGRIHTVAEVETTVATVRAAGFDNINLDLMFGLPGQTMEQWYDSLHRALALDPEHLAVYCLTIEEDTEFWRQFQRGALHPDAERELAMYEYLIETLTGAGYHHYEISNFAKPGRECRHNIAYWEGKDYLGLGPSACSTIGLRRWENIADTPAYVSAIQKSRSPVDFEEQLSAATKQGERIAFGLRMLDGIPGELVNQHDLTKLLDDNLVRWRADRLQLTRRGVLFADEIATEFVGN